MMMSLRMIDSRAGFYSAHKKHECPLVRRDKVSILSGCNSRPATVAPAGSNRSGGGGNDTAEAFDAKGRVGGSASRQAVTQVNAIEASKLIMWEPTR